ncbi:hypothetical protein AB0F42_15260 [Streptomyces buecherae]|uniref:hypothetical protein n=1 Tax=Streptomyces buecherae TaxID=2763006 RepID=UPI0033FA7992
MISNMCAPYSQISTSGDPSTQTRLQVARRAATFAAIAADGAMIAACRSRSGATARLEAAMHAAHKEAVEAEGHADRAEQYADDPTMPSSAPLYSARAAIDHAVRAQSAAGAETTAEDLRAELERKLTAAEYTERETERRREEAEREAKERAATGMDADNRDQAVRNRYLAEGHVAELGWTAGHVRVLEAAESGRLYWRDGRVRQAARRGVWSGGRRISRDRTEALFAAWFLVAVRQDDGTRLLVPSPMGQVAVELARLPLAGLHDSDQAAYEARFARVRRRHKRRDDQKAAARMLPPLKSSAQKLYRKPVLLAEQQARAERDAAERWEGGGGCCPDTVTPRPAADPVASAHVRSTLPLRRHVAMQAAL